MSPYNTIFLAGSILAILPSTAESQAIAPPVGESSLQLGAAVSGVIAQIFVADGAQVEKGQLLVSIDCRALEAEIRLREARLAAAEAAFERTRNGPRADEIAIAAAEVGVSRARADEAQAALQRANELREGTTITRAALLQAQRDARVTAAQLQVAQKTLDLAHAGSRAEDVAEAKAQRDAAAAVLDRAKARYDQCFVRAPAAGTVKVVATLGQFISSNVPVTLVQLTTR